MGKTSYMSDYFCLVFFTSNTFFHLRYFLSISSERLIYFLLNSDGEGTVQTNIN